MIKPFRNVKGFIFKCNESNNLTTEVFKIETQKVTKPSRDNRKGILTQ